MQTKFLLDSGNPNEYKEIGKLAKEKGSELWGSTTNPSLIAKNLAGKKVTQKEALHLQKEIVMEILHIVPGAVSAEVYADEKTTAQEMIKQGEDIASWHERVVVKLPTTIEGFKAREILRRQKVTINNTLVFSQQQVFAICLQEKLLHEQYGSKIKTVFPSFISPFLGRLDDIGQDGISLLANAMKMKQDHFDNHVTLWMLEASIRTLSHLKAGIDLDCELATIPAKILQEWLSLTAEQQKDLKPSPTQPQRAVIPYWSVSQEILQIPTLHDFIKAISTNKLTIHHPLTDKGIEKFVADWQTILK